MSPFTAEAYPRRVRAGISSPIAGAATSRRRVLGSAWLLAFVWCFLLLLAASARNAQPLGGDEPHYLVVADSLFRDGDVDVANGYRSGRISRFATPGIDPHVGPALLERPDGPWYSQHGVGLPVLLALPVGLAERGGAIVAMTAIAAVVLLLAFNWSRGFTRSARPASAAVILLATAPSFLAVQGRVFPDLLVAALLLACLLLLERPRQQWWTVSLLAALVAATPWIHFKNSLVFATIAVLAVLRVLRDEERGRRGLYASVLVLVPAASLGLYELSVHRWYGSWSPSSMYPPANRLFDLNPAVGIAAASFDTAAGLFTGNPALLLVLVGAPFWLRAARGPFLRLALVVGPTIVLQATFSDWSGGFSPPGRYALQFVPAFAPAIAIALERARGPWRILVGVLVAAQLLLTTAYLWLTPSWGRTDGVSPLHDAIDRKLGLSLDDVMPAFGRHADLLHGDAQLAGWVAFAVALLVVGAVLAIRGTGGDATTP